MRRFKLPVVVTPDLTANNILINALNAPTQQQGPNQSLGITYSEIEVRLPIIRKVRRAKTSLLLEEAEWEKLCECIRAAQWAGVNEDVHAVCKAALEAESVEEAVESVEEAVKVKPKVKVKPEKGD